MGKHYTQLTFEERCEVARLLAAGTSQRKIAAALGRAPSTITREVKRNGSQTAGYEPRYADDQAWARCWRGSNLAREAGAPVISHETIYRFVYGQQARTKDGNWRQYLPRAKSKRGWRGRRGGSPASFIAQRRPLAERPQAADRQTPGHWEVDLMLFRTYGQAVLALHERHSRLCWPRDRPARRQSPSQRPCTTCSPCCLQAADRPPRSTTAPSSPTSSQTPVTTASMTWASKLSSAIPTLPGRKAASRTPSSKKPLSDACGAACPARPTWHKYPRSALRNWCTRTTTRRASASASKRQLKYSSTKCCT